MKTYGDDAFQALTEAIDNGGRIRMSIPAQPDRDTDLRIARALDELRAKTLLLSRVTLALDPNDTDNPPQEADVRAAMALTLIRNYEEDNK